MISTTIGIGHSSGGKGCAAVRWGETESCHRTVSAEETNKHTILYYCTCHHPTNTLQLYQTTKLLLYYILLPLLYYIFSSALLRRPSLLLCDEVTSSVDALAEREIIEALRISSSSSSSSTATTADDSSGNTMEQRVSLPVSFLTLLVL